MELDERKMKILKAIISTYLETGDPVGSRTIAKDSDLHLSSATIRNEMADLEELGYILQPHTSAGRIPSDQGYRLYVDMLMEEKAENRQTVQIPSHNYREQPEECYLGDEFKGILADGIRSLKENEQTVISLYYKEELSARDIAKVLGVSEPRISQIHSSAIRKLKTYIENRVK